MIVGGVLVAAGKDQVIQKLAILGCAAIAGCAANADQVGVTGRTFVDAERDRVLEAYVWYPTLDRSTERLAETPVYEGFSAVIDAGIAGDRHPLVLLAHGSYGNRASLSWLAVELARRGAIVIAANHPGSTTGDATPETLVEMWNQPEDLRFMIDAVSRSDIGQHVDFDRIIALGTSLGGYTALALAGARLDIQRFLEFCDIHDDGACQGLAHAVAGRENEFSVQANADRSDERISASIAFVPGFTESITEESVRGLETPILLIGAEFDSQVPVELHSRPLARLLPMHSRYHEVGGATHFSFLPTCTPDALEILARDSEEFVCEEPTAKSRGEIHAELLTVVELFLEERDLLRPRNDEHVVRSGR